jgi:NADH:ubiquinone oxidoreductase subunit F (NADH-binding)/NADH:ubiquinone oxidoreductase subunit E
VVTEENNVVKQLSAIQHKYGYVPQKELYELSKRIGVPVYELHGVATFFPHYRLTPPPRATLHVCMDMPCHLKRAPQLKARLEELAAAGGTGDVEVKGCSCLGQCDGAPAMLINDQPYARRTEADLVELSQLAIGGREVPHEHFEGVKGPFKTDPYENESERYGALKALVAGGDYEGVIAKIKEANLKGMGGAGFPTHIKWNTVRGRQAEQKYVVCNADESEVGTFKDRELMKNLPYLLVEAMTICGLVTGATKGYIYSRHEYHEQIEILEKEIARAKFLGILGDNVLGSGKAFHLEVFVSPGGYVQGEETALIEAIEGKRGQPRNKPFDVGLEKGGPAFTGVFGMPTVVNNVETFSYVPVILVKGPETFKGFGINGCQGLKWIGVSGDVNKPGVFEVPMGTTYEDVIYGLAGGITGGRKMYAFAPSGPSFGLLPGSMANLKLDWNTSVDVVGRILGSGAVVAVAEGRDVLDLALNFTRFYRNESCGKCVPCRVGSQKLVDLIVGIMQGSASADDLTAVTPLAKTLDMTSICGLGQVVSKPIQSVMRFFPEVIEKALKGGSGGMRTVGVTVNGR